MLKAKKLVSVVLTIGMLFSLTATAFAAPTEPVVLESYSIEALQNDPTVTFEENDNAISLLSDEYTIYGSTLSISGGSSLYGAVRNYEQDRFFCNITNTVLGPDSWGTLTVKVCKKNILDYDVLATQRTTLSYNGQSSYLSFGYCGAGKRAFAFFTDDQLVIDSANVEMSSR